jgi:hypothetical protein
MHILNIDCTASERTAAMTIITAAIIGRRSQVVSKRFFAVTI